MNEPRVKRTTEELRLIDDYMSESNTSICQAISILSVFIDIFNFDMSRPTDMDVAYIKDRWDDAANILYAIKNQLHTASDKLEEVLYENVREPLK